LQIKCKSKSKRKLIENPSRIKEIPNKIIKILNEKAQRMIAKIIFGKAFFPSMQFSVFPFPTLL
jgi:hypothetical protein